LAFSTITGSGASDVTSYVGTTGVDSIVFEGNTSNFFVGSNAANDLIAFDNVAALETGTYTAGTVKGGAGDDTFTDLAGVNLVGTWLNANGGDDVIGQGLAINALNSTVQGGQGEDNLLIGNGTGTIFNGNRDDDTVTVQGVVNTSTIGGGQGEDTIATGGAAVTVTNTSWLLGNDDDTFNETLVNDLGVGNTIDGGDGNDTITVVAATAADVTINGGAGVDQLNGGAGNDSFDGGDGSDRITGMTDNDVMTGGASADSFRYTAIAESIGSAAGDLAAGTVDIITDFTTTSDNIATGALMTTAGGFNTGAAAGYATFGAALTAANVLNGAVNEISVVAVGTGTTWTSYLMGVSAAGAVNVTDFVVQIGATNSYATVAAANAAFVAADLV